jgi:hypothetical protein
MVLKRLQDLELEAAGVVRGVSLDFGALKHEAHRAVGEIYADRHLGVSLVGAVAEPRETARARGAIVEIVVCAFVVVGLAGVRMHQVVLIEQHHL